MKWADYLISAARYGADRRIEAAIRHEDPGDGISAGEPVDRLTISSDIRKGRTYVTVYSGGDTWRRGNAIRSYSVGGEPYLRIDSNRVEMDNLGDLPDTDAEAPAPGQK